MELPLAAHPVELEQSIAQDGILVEDLIKLPDLEEGNFVEVYSFHFPILPSK